MPDPTPDLVALAAQVKVLSGDLNRRFEILSGDLSSSVNQLNSRMDALSTSRKVALPFKPALTGDWLEGTTSPLLHAGSVSGQVEAGGFMSFALPNLSRIGLFRASVRISDVALSCKGTLIISFGRALTTGDGGNIVQLSCPLVPGIADLQGDPNPGTEFVDNDRFKYSLEALILITGPPDVQLQPGMVVLESLEVDCIVA